MKDEILESLAQLEQNLQKMDSARAMVESTINAYKGVSVDINAYSKVLEDTSESIKSLIEELKSNKESISVRISAELRAILDKFETTVTTYRKTAEGLQTVFESQSNNLISGLSGDLSKSTDQMLSSTNKIQQSFEQSTDTIANSFNKNTADSIHKLNILVNTFTESVNTFNESTKARFESLQSEHQLISKRQKIQIALLIVIIVIGALHMILWYLMR